VPNINITVAGKIATNTTTDVVIVCGNSDYTVTFDLDAEWAAETDRTARFSYIRDGRLRYKDQPFQGNTVAVPKLSNVRQVTVGVYAGTPDDPGDLHTSTPAAILCKLSTLCGDAVEEITQEEKDGLVAQMGDLAALETTAKSSLVAAVNEVRRTAAAGGGASGGNEIASNYVEIGALPYTVGNVTELYLEPSEDCSLVIGGSDGNNLIADLKTNHTPNNNSVIEGLLSEEYVGTHTVILTATATNTGNNFYDVFTVEGLTVGREYTFSCTVDLSGVTGAAYARIAVGGDTGLGSLGGAYCQTSGERYAVTFTATAETAKIQLFLWTGSKVAVGDAITFSNCLLCEGTSTTFGSAVTYTLTAGEKTRVLFSEGDTIPAVDGVTVTVYKYAGSAGGGLFVFLGDSIPCFDSNTGGTGAIPDYLREKCGGTWKNFCVGGTTMSAYRTTGNGYEHFTLDAWAESIAAGDFSSQEQGVTDGAAAGSTSYSISKKVGDAKALDWNAVKRIFLAYGTNDLAYGVSEVGTVADPAAKNGTMCAALRYAVQTIQTAYPTIEIVVCGIIYRYADSPSVAAIIAANEAIRATCESIGVPFVPLFENMGVNQWNRAAFLYDGTHPNAAGKERYADTVQRCLRL